MMRFLIMLFISLISFQVRAFSWSDLWSTSDQQGQNLMDKGQYAKAKETFERKDWVATAAYKAGDYEHAEELFKELKTEQGYYNDGNALAHMGKYEQALEAYNKVLAINPNNQDAIYNHKLVSDLLKKDKEQKQNQDQENNSQKNKDQQGKDQQGKDQQGKDQQGKDQQGKDQQGKDQQGKDQQGKDQQGKDQTNQDQQSGKQDQSKKGNKKTQGEAQSEAEHEKQQAKEQWLRLIPDDPGGLIREKFLRDHLRRERGWYQ